MKHDPTKLRLVRESLGMTQEKLAILSNVSERTVQRAEAGANMRLDTLADFAAVLELPLSELVFDPDEIANDKEVSLRRVRTARTLIDDLAKAGVASFECEIDPSPAEISQVLELVSLIEERLPTPWQFDQHPALVSLSAKIQLAATIAALIVQLTDRGICLYSSASWISAKYPRYDMDEGFRYTTTSQHYEKVMTLQLLVCRSLDEKVYRKPVTDWGLEQAPSPMSLDDDVPF
jgi:transcriptional regulator with XRE-family HTH domain